jgi:hypothetical protein
MGVILRAFYRNCPKAEMREHQCWGFIQSKLPSIAQAGFTTLRLRALAGDVSFKPFAVGECCDSERTIGDWPDEDNAWLDNPVGAFDFPLRWRLRDFFATVTASGGADEEKDH